LIEREPADLTELNCRPADLATSPTEIVILPDTAAIAGLAADAIGSLLAGKPDAVLGLARGSSPLAIYDAPTARCADGTVSFAQATGFTLDEYVGLPADHPE
jgi:glucosamine-6-phosphate deaminase